MVYKFLNFQLNTDTKELSAENRNIPLTRQGFDLLLFLVQNPGKVFSKEDLIREVWQGRYVTENTIDQSIFKLRRTLGSVKGDTYIKTAYGKGFVFVPKVNPIEISVDAKPSGESSVGDGSFSIKMTIVLPLLALLVSILVGYLNLQTGATQKPESLLMFMAPENGDAEDWLNQASVPFIDQLFEYAGAAIVKKLGSKPQNLDRQAFVQNQWQLAPDLKVVTTHVLQNKGQFTIKLQIIDRLTNTTDQSFSSQSLSVAVKQASEWLVNEINSPESLKNIESLIPNDSYVVELYMRGLSSFTKGEFDKAGNLAELCISEQPDFLLARLLLAKVINAQGQPEKALAMLETLSDLDLLPHTAIEIQSEIGDIYDTQGKYEQAKRVYLEALETFQAYDGLQLNRLRYNLAHTYYILAEFDDALAQLDGLEKNIKRSEGLDLLAHVFQKQASVYQKIGRTKEALRYAEKSLSAFSELVDMIGEAKIYNTMARITNHQSKYKQSIEYIQKSLSITRTLGYQIGIGANLNELTYVLMVQGEFTKAIKANAEMERIAIEIDYGAMLLISKQFAFDIARNREKWAKARLYLAEHLQLSKASNNKAHLLKNKLLQVDIDLDQGILDSVESLIADIQAHIDETREIRLQPRVNKHLARYYFQTDRTGQGIALLLSTRRLAKETDDGEVYVEINNLLAEQYLQANQIEKAAEILDDSRQYNPLPYPFLLLKSKVRHAAGHDLDALDLANESKRRANEYWSIDDERYLSDLRQSRS